MRQQLPILWLAYETRHLLAASFLRFQEHYESPQFRGKIFDWEEFMDWYAQECGDFTYLTDWSGFNLPDYAFEPFLRGEFAPLTRKEAFLLDTVRDYPRPFYVIGTVQADDTVLAHELVHGLYYLYPKYRAAVDEVVAKHSLADLRQHLLSMAGYCEDVLNDEINAYLVANLELGVDFSENDAVALELRQVFRQFFRRNVWQPRGRHSLLRRCERIDVYCQRDDSE